MSTLLQKFHTNYAQKRLVGLKNWALAHKIASAILVLVILVGGYYTYKHFTNTSGETRYVLGKAKIGTVETTVSGTGYVSAENQIDLKSKVSGDIVQVLVKPGDQVVKGQLIAQVDSRDAALALESAQISYDKLVKPAKASDITEAKNNLTKSYNDTWNAISSTFLDMPNIIAGMETVLYSQTGYLNSQNTRSLSDSVVTYSTQAGVSFDKAKNLYEDSIDKYKGLSRTSPQDKIDALSEDTYAMLRQTADALKDSRNAINYIQTQYPTHDSSNGASTATSINTWSSSINSDLSSLISSKNSLDSNKDALDQLMTGADALDIKSEELSLRQKQYAYSDYFIRAPFDGVIAKVGIKVGDPASGAIISTIVGNKKMADIPLNEIDAASVAVGQSVKVTFDAIPDKVFTGTVEEVDLAGTVEQGVVTYNVKVSFEAEGQIKAGMSASADIVTNQKNDVLVVPASAIKTRGKIHYVEILSSSTTPTQKNVEIGISNDSFIEITSGLEEGDEIIVRTVSGTATTAAAAPSLFGGSNTTVRTSGAAATRATR